MTKKTRIRIGIVIVITCVVCFSDWSFAVEDDVNQLGSIAWTVDFIVSVLSRIWVIFAKLAGDFLTNGWVYGEKLGIDVLLWQYWNIAKNMANFCLGFYLVYVIFRGLISGGKEDVLGSLKKVLLGVLVAGVGIQASWFITSAVIDLSTVTLAAVGAFPSQVVSNNENVKESIKKSMHNTYAEFASGKIYELFPNDGAANSFTKVTMSSLNGTLTEERFFDSLMPNEHDVAGPLYFLGFSILKVDEINSVGGRSNDALKKSIINLIIQGGTTIIYGIEIGVLCIIALMRILYLWMFIVLSPFAILLACIQKAGEKDLLGKGFIADLMKQINLKTFFAKVFQPVIIVLGISLCMIFVTLINSIINNDPTRSMDNFDIGGVAITTTQDETNTNNDDKTYTTKVEGNLLEFAMSHVGKGILDFMLSIITVILVYVIIDKSIKFSNSLSGGQDFLSKKIESIQKGVNGAITSIPVVPVAGYDKDGVPTTHHMSLGQVFGVGDDLRLGERNSLIDEGMRRAEGVIMDKYREQNQIIDSWFEKEGEGSHTVQLIARDRIQIENAGSSVRGLDKLTAKRDAMSELGNRSEGGLKSGDGYGMILNPDASDKFWQDQFKEWLTKVETEKDASSIQSRNDKKVWIDMIERWNDENNKEKGLEAMFKNNRSKEEASVRAYADFFGLNLDVYDWEHLKVADISRKS